MTGRNDFCRHLSIVRYAFSGIPTLLKEHISDEEYQRAFDTTDILYVASGRLSVHRLTTLQERITRVHRNSGSS